MLAFILGAALIPFFPPGAMLLWVIAAVVLVMQLTKSGVGIARSRSKDD